MIFTECPTCDEPQLFGWENGMQSGWFPSVCRKCKSVMWVQATSIGGITLDKEDFRKNVMKPGDEDKIRELEERAIDLNNIEEEFVDPTTKH